MYNQKFMDLIEREARANFGSETGVEGHGRYSFITRTNYGVVVDNDLENLVVCVETRVLNSVSIYGLEWGVRQKIPLRMVGANDIGSLDSVRGVKVFGYLRLGGLDTHAIQNSAIIYTDDFETITRLEAKLPDYLRQRGAKRIVGPRMCGRILEEVLPGMIKRYAQTPINHLCVLPGNYTHQS